MNDKIIAKLEEQIPLWMETAVVPGLSIALINKGRLGWAKGFGVANSATGQAVTTDIIFEAASLSKPVYAYAALQLCAVGVLELDRPLMDYLPPEQQTADILFDNIVNELRLRQITMRHILSHTPGFPNWPPKGENLRIHLPPGQRFSYSGSGFMFLQQVVEQITNRDALTFIQKSVLEPLGMKRSAFVWTEREAKLGPVAQPHDAAGVGGEKEQWDKALAAASLHCTPTDFARFMAAILSPSAISSPDTTILDRNLLREMLTPQIQMNDNLTWHEDWPRSQVNLESDLFWGLGWGLERGNGHFGKLSASRSSFWHWGDNGDFKAFAIGFPNEGAGMVMMSNGRNGHKLWLQILQQTFGGAFPALSWLDRM